MTLLRHEVLRKRGGAYKRSRCARLLSLLLPQKRGQTRDNQRLNDPKDGSEGNIKEGSNCSKGSWASPRPKRPSELSGAPQTIEFLPRNKACPAL